jgi:hypothetical protein
MTKPAHPTQPKTPLSRRTLFAGAGTVGALAAAAAALPLVRPTEAVVAATGPKPDDQAGYQLTEHVKRYYRTARI